MDGFDTSMEDSFDDQEPMNADIPLHDENVSYLSFILSNNINCIF